MSMLTLHHVDNDIKNKEPNSRSNKSYPALYKKQKTNMRKKIEPCLKGHGVSICKGYQFLFFS